MDSYQILFACAASAVKFISRLLVRTLGAHLLQQLKGRSLVDNAG